MRVPDQEYFDIALREYKLLEGLGEGHPNIMKVFDIFFNELHEKIFMIMDYAGEGSNLTTFIKSYTNSDDAENAFIPEDIILNIMRQLLEGLRYLHEHLICHRDIKPGNLYLTKDLKQLKIIDFNVALTFKSSPAVLFGVTGEEAFSAPELSSGQKYDERVDVWSAGVVMFQLMSLGQKLKFFAYDEADEIQA